MVAQRIRLAACTVNWGVRGIEGVILEMPVIGALVPSIHRDVWLERQESWRWTVRGLFFRSAVAGEGPASGRRSRQHEGNPNANNKV